jgi:hypothetical protein
MTEYLKTILTGQYEASLAMLKQCVRLCQPEHWEGKIANSKFQRTAYHTLFFADLYLTPREEAFELRDLHRRGGWTEPDEEAPRIGLPKDDTVEYVDICRAKMLETMASESAASLEGPSGFSWLPFSRGELHLYNIRHIQHHSGQMSAYLRRVDPELRDTAALDWVSTGWA